MDTEYRGSKYWACVLEALNLGPKALLYRVPWEISKRLGLHKQRYQPSQLTNDDVLGMFPLPQRTPEALLEYFRTRDNVRFIFRRGDLPQIRREWEQRLPAARETLVAEAERACRHEFEFFGSKKVKFAGEIDWHDEMEGRGRWPLRHWSTIDVRSPTCTGDCKLVWELNRTPFFITLARAYALTQESRYAEELCRQMASWIQQNPPEIGMNWYANMEVALRSTAWLFALEMTLDWPGWSPVLFTDVIRSLIDHLHHLYRDIVYSEWCAVGNHLLGEALGLAMLGLYLPELPHAARYRDKGTGILFRKGPQQLLADGVNFENAISYHRFVFYMYLLVGLMLERNGGQMPALLWDRLEGMCDFVMRIHAPSGVVSQYGDWDSARTIPLDDISSLDFRSMLCTGAVRFQRGDLKAAAGEFREEALWLLGPDAGPRFDKLAAQPSAKLDSAHPDGGFYLWRSDWSEQAEYALFKCAPFLAHTHADNLMLLYSGRGKDWLVDRGTYIYNLFDGNWPWRTYFRGTSAHNAITVDGFSQALALRAFRWLKCPKQRVYRYHADEHFGYVAGSTAFRHLPSKVRHARSVLLVRGRYVLVLDALLARARHDYELLWHVAPEHDVRIAENGTVFTMDEDGANLWLRAIGTTRLAPRVVRGEISPVQGWHSQVYGQKEPADSVVYSTRATGPIYLVTLFTLVDQDAGAPELGLSLDAETQAWGDHVVASVSGPGFAERVCLPNPGRLTERHFPDELLWIERNGERTPVLS